MPSFQLNQGADLERCGKGWNTLWTSAAGRSRAATCPAGSGSCANAATPGILEGVDGVPVGPGRRGRGRACGLWIFWRRGVEVGYHLGEAGPAEPVGLVEYLALLEPKDKQLRQLRKAVLKSVDGVNERRPDASWDRAAGRLRKVTSGLDRLSLSIQGVKPPAELKQAHSNLAESVAVLESYVYDVANALSTRIPAQLISAANEDSTRMAVLRGTWEAAVATYARKLGVAMPAWLGGPSLEA